MTDEEKKRLRSERNHRYYVKRGRFIRKNKWGHKEWSKIPSEKVRNMFPVRRNGMQQLKKSKTLPPQPPSEEQSGI